MKTLKNFIWILAIILMAVPGQAQSQSEKEKQMQQEQLEKERKEMVREFEKQKKEMALEMEKQKKQMALELEKQKQMMQEQMKQEKYLQGQELEKMLTESKVMEEEELRALMEDQKHVREDALRRYEEARENYQSNQNVWTIPVPDVRFEKQQFATPFVIGDLYGLGRESSALNISKGLTDLTFTSSFKYDVQKESANLKFSASGSVEKGSIQISLKDPKGKVIHEFEISPLADVNWSQNLKWTEEEAKQQIGQWTITVAAKNATGNYQVSIRAN